MIIYQNGYFRNWDYCDKHISNLRNKQVVEYRLSVLKFWEKHGLAAALEYATALHPKHKCSKATLYRWRKALKDSGKRDRIGRCSLSALDPKSTRPKHFRRAGDYTELYEPIKQMLDEHYFLGRHKVYHSLIGKQKKGELKLKNSSIPSASTIGRIIARMRKLHQLPENKRLILNGKYGCLYTVKKKKIKKLRRNGYIPKNPGDLVQMDGVITYCCHKRIYILNAIDYVSGKVVSRILPSNKSCHTAAFLDDLDKEMGFTVKHILTDNGAEFMSVFHDRAEILKKIHFYNYVKQPRWNGKVERFNRTLQEEWLYDPDVAILIAEDREAGNRSLQEYITWYNEERPHQSLNYMTPCEYLIYLNCRGEINSQMC